MRDLLLVVPKIGSVRAGRILAECGIAHSKTLAGLTDRQRGELINLFRHCPARAGRSSNAGVCRPIAAQPRWPVEKLWKERGGYPPLTNTLPSAQRCDRLAASAFGLQTRRFDARTEFTHPTGRPGRPAFPTRGLM